MKQHELKKAYNVNEIPNAFSAKPLDGVNLNKFYVDTIEERTADPYRSPIEDIFDACTTPSDDHIFLLMGHTGCGKSTELNKLAVRFREDGYMVKIVKCLDDLGNNPLYTDLLILVGEALFQIANEIHCTLDSELGRQILEFWNTEIAKNTVEKDEYVIDVGAGIEGSTPSVFEKIFKAFVSIKTGIKLQQADSREYKTKIERRSEHWYNAIAGISDLITEELDGRQPIIVFEDLDKLDRGNPDIVWDMFSVHAVNLCNFTFPVVYTFPISLSYSPKYGTLSGFFIEKILPMIELKHADGSPCPAGFSVIKQIVEDRSDISLIEDQTLRLMIEKTGGSLRDLFTIIRESSIRARRRRSGRIEMEDANAALNALKAALAKRIEIKDYNFLRNIINGNKRNIEDRAILLEMLTGNIVLEYNGNRWQDVHPLVVDFLNEQS
ncbi:MAG: hypothetical protein Q4A32_02510 [Lachnospiraceae bacterium]|nr:hypothetical protein [Lachnospiraceae bacterium]